MKGIFITIEGPDGSGKTTAASRLAKYLEEQGYSVCFTREPGGSIIGEEIRDILHSRANTAMDRRTEALLFAASRRQHLIETVIPAVNEGKVVICDRYIDSSLAYQGYARGLGIDEVLNVNLFATEGRLPDLTVLFDLPAEEGIRRINANPEREVTRLDAEKIEFHEKVYKGYQEVVKRYPDRIVSIDASKSVDEVYEQLKNVIMKKLKEW